MPFVHFVLKAALTTCQRLRRHALVRSDAHPVSGRTHVTILFRREPNIVGGSSVQSDYPSVDRMAIGQALNRLIDYDTVRGAKTNHSANCVLGSIRTLRLFLRTAVPSNRTTVAGRTSGSGLLRHMGRTRSRDERKLCRSCSSFSESVGAECKI